MAHALGMRATSLAGSAGLLALLVAAALSVTYTTQWLPPPDNTPIIDIATEPPPEPPPPVARPLEPPPPLDAQQITNEPAQTIPLTNVEPIPYTGPAVTPQPAYVTITNPRWSQTPRNLARYYPARALAMGIEGQVVLDCAVGLDGRLACIAVSETPPNWGFAAAAIRISQDYRMVPAMRDGVAVEGRYRMRVPFNVR